MACQTRNGVAGVSKSVTPTSDSASVIAFIAGVIAPTVPASRAPFSNRASKFWIFSSAAPTVMMPSANRPVRSLLTMEDTLTALESAFRELAAGRASNQPRRRVAAGASLATMSAALPAIGLMGFKAYTVTKTEGLREFKGKILQIANPPLEMDRIRTRRGRIPTDFSSAIALCEAA